MPSLIIKNHIKLPVNTTGESVLSGSGCHRIIVRGKLVNLDFLFFSTGTKRETVRKRTLNAAASKTTCLTHTFTHSHTHSEVNVPTRSHFPRGILQQHTSDRSATRCQNLQTHKAAQTITFFFFVTKTPTHMWKSLPCRLPPWVLQRVITVLLSPCGSVMTDYGAGSERGSVTHAPQRILHIEVTMFHSQPPPILRSVSFFFFFIKTTTITML